MARQANKRGRTKMKMSKAMKKRSYCRKKNLAKKQQRKKKDDDSEIEEALTRVRDYKGKKIKPEVSSVDTDDGTSLATTQDLLEFSDETSAGIASSPSNSTLGKKDNKCDEKGKKKRKRKEKKESSEISGDSKSTIEKAPTRKSSKKQRPNPTRQRSNQRGENQTQITKGNESSKPSESAGSGNMNKGIPESNNIQKGEPNDGKEPCKDKVTPKDVGAKEEEHVEESSSSSG